MLVTLHYFSILYLNIKRIILVDGIIFDMVASAWQYILGIPKKYKKTEIVVDIIYQYMLIFQKLGYEAQNITALL